MNKTETNKKEDESTFCALKSNLSTILTIMRADNARMQMKNCIFIQFVIQITMCRSHVSQPPCNFP